MITQSPGAVIPIENIPEELAERNQWVCWRYDERDGKLTKVPYTPDPGARRTLMRASSTDPATWATFSEAVDACGASEGYYGVGFVFSDDDPYVGIDIDNCRSPESSDIAE